MTFDPTQNRVPTYMLTADELAALKAAKHGLLFWNNSTKAWQDNVTTDAYLYPGEIYRAKPAPAPTLSITVGGVTNVVAAPVTEALKDGTRYWVVEPTSPQWAYELPWNYDATDHRNLSRGLIHLTEAAAVSHAKAMAKAGCV